MRAALGCTPGSTPGDHRLFPNPKGSPGWYCTGCKWRFSYHSTADRAREVWGQDARHDPWANQPDVGPYPEAVPHEPQEPISAPASPNPVPVEGEPPQGRAGARRGYADPVAQAEIDRLAAENERLRGKVERVEALLPFLDRSEVLIPGIKLSAAATAGHIRAALADPEVGE